MAVAVVEGVALGGEELVVCQTSPHRTQTVPEQPRLQSHEAVDGLDSWTVWFSSSKSNDIAASPTSLGSDEQLSLELITL